MRTCTQQHSRHELCSSQQAQAAQEPAEIGGTPLHGQTKIDTYLLIYNFFLLENILSLEFLAT